MALAALVSTKTLMTKKRHVTWLGNTEILALQTRDGVRVYSGMCPHQGGPLGEGRLISEALTCPWHGCTFDLSDGRCIDYGTCTNISNMTLTPIPFEIREGMLYVEVHNDG